MPTFSANDGASLFYETYGASSSPPLILLHGFTGSGKVFQRNTAAFAEHFHVVVPDLRGHGRSAKPRGGYHVARLALDLQNLIAALQLPEGRIAAIGASLGAAILWSYAELFSSRVFSHVVYVDQAPLQNYADDWGAAFGNRGLNNAAALAELQRVLATDPAAAHRGTVAACLGYRSHPQPGDPTSNSATWRDDEAFFVGEAMRGEGRWFGKLMADHTALDWREAIEGAFGPGSGSETRTLVVASARSGCFPAAGPLRVVDIINGESEGEGRARGVAVEWGGHWCYWEAPGRFNALVGEFLGVDVGV